MIPFKDTLHKRLDEVRLQKMQELALSPSTGEDAYGDYRQRCGFIQGIAAAFEMAAQLEIDMLKG